ncbi:sigma 54-interacting transcriptional regulator [Desulforhopalus singaporensis]|uniref:HTH-type transcriptional regulatory protein TyrR n=1 Tax=Desulforhopalus singaporensis TaxID=91360 RepID=A0A1H0KHN6_9BACT|nr:sigma 54-interacting transcriptional regulator [Desulforhopalus singaporensis]SDO55326.1 PAS domain S-box-containing protein/TyrR family helix-turn-helix domain-containing protein [Desulforhopalus singaporensis]
MQLPDTEQIFKHCVHGIIGTDVDGKVTHVNDSARNIVKKSDRLVEGVSVLEVLPETGKLIFKVIEKRKPYFGYQVEGKEEHLIVSINVIQKDEKVIGTVCSFVDMKEFESVARNLDFIDLDDRKFETVFDVSFDGLWLIGSDGKVILINNAVEKSLGMKKSEVIGQHVQTFVKRGFYNMTLTEEVVRTRKKVSQLQTALMTKKQILCTGIPVLDKNGEVAMVVVNERDISRLIAIQQELDEVTREKERYKDELALLVMHELQENEVVAENHKMRSIMQTALKFAKMDASDILIQGESGTGKGLAAKFIHSCGKRSAKPFIQINCAAIPEAILEAELFGYDKGAFTGAKESGKPGLIELADEGTLFLDEIGELPPAGQAKLLKYLDDHQVMRIGGTTQRKVDCIIIAATNQDLEKLIEEKKFRADLYYRLNSLQLTIPPLRERPEDLFELTNQFLGKANEKFGTNNKINPMIIAMMQTYSFPGNVRELKNIINKGVVMSESEFIDRVVIECIGKDVMEEVAKASEQDSRIKSLDDIMAIFEKQIIKNAIAQYNSTRELAKYLNISQPTIVRKLKKYGLSTR